jgi:hypothetical protein
MGIAALITWILAAGGGLFMLGKWIAGGGTRATAATNFAPAVIFGHFALAAAGLVVWIVYLATKTEALIWVAFALLFPVATLGVIMFVRWWPGRAGSTTVESRFPQPVVFAHGLFAVSTAVLVLLAGLGVG